MVKQTRGIHEESIKTANHFYLRVDNCTGKVDKKKATKIGPYPQAILKKKTYAKFNEEHPGFMELRPENVKTLDKNKFMGSVPIMPKCANIELCLKILKQSFTCTTPLNNKYDILNITLCPRKGNVCFEDCNKCI